MPRYAFFAATHSDYLQGILNSTNPNKSDICGAFLTLTPLINWSSRAFLSLITVYNVIESGCLHQSFKNLSNSNDFSISFGHFYHELNKSNLDNSSNNSNNPYELIILTFMTFSLYAVKLFLCFLLAPTGSSFIISRYKICIRYKCNACNSLYPCIWWPYIAWKPSTA